MIKNITFAPSFIIKAEKKNKMDKVSYALGLSIGNNFENSGIKDLQVEDFVKGLTDVLSGNQPAITYDEAKEVINDYFMKLQKERLEINKKAGEEFLNITTTIS